MKKLLYSAITVAAVLSLAACSGANKEETKPGETKAAETTSETDASKKGSDTDVDSNSDISSIAGPVDISEMTCFNATVQKVDGNKLTVEYEDGTSLTVDTADAFINPAWTLMPGDEVNIYYNGEGDVPADGTKVAEVVMSVPYEFTSEDYSAEPQVYGEIVKLDDKSVTIREEEGAKNDNENGPKDGTEYTFKLASYSTTIGEPKVGDYAQALYLGELGSDSAVAYRICTEEMMEDASSEVYEIKGTLAQFKTGIIYLKTDEGDVFGFTVDGDEELAKLAQESTGKKVKISYTDSIRQRVSTCNGITVVE